MRKLTMVVLILELVAVIGLSVNYFVSHYGSITYQWKTNLRNYKEYRLIGDSTLNGYVKANGEISVYILTRGDFERLKRGKPVKGYRTWEHVKAVEFNNVKIPERDYLLVVKNEEKGMQWISVKLVDKREN
ncbi:hypothetical protein [Thermococcus sp.]|uniref:hypothetical protein n=1 Tax=Thermococcus sp. TaxID=35749 RepID=UPI0025D44E3F|nr:hypothetical protein [Thermococcus sp.]